MSALATSMEYVLFVILTMELSQTFEQNMKQVLQESKIAFADKQDEAAFVRRAAEKAGRGEPVHIPLDFAVGKVPNLMLTQRPVNKP